MNSISLSSLRRTTLALAIVASLGCGATVNARAATSGSGLFTVANATTLGRGDAVIGALPMNQPMHVEVVLKLRNKDALDAFIANADKDLARGLPARALTRDQVMANYAPTPQSAQTIASYLTGMGFRNIVIASDRLSVSADGTALTARNAFSTTFAQIRTHDGRVAFAPTDAVRMPTALQDTVRAVLGLQTVNQAHTNAIALPKGHTRSNGVHNYAAPLGVEPINPNWFTSIYGTYGASTANTPIGIITDGPTSILTQDLAHGGYSIPFSVVSTDCEVTPTCDRGGSYATITEWELDSQTLAGILGAGLPTRQAASGITFYDIPSIANQFMLYDDFHAVTTANTVKVVVASIAECETTAQGDGFAGALDDLLEIAYVQNQTFSVPAGNQGSDECGNGGTSPSYPASSPWVIAVGGTTLSVDDAGGGTGPGPGGQPGWVSEVVWPNTGGSVSTFEPQVVQSGMPGITGTTRNVPDVAFDADPNSGAVIHLFGTPTTIGGTGMAASLFAGVWANIVQIQGGSFFFGETFVYRYRAEHFHDVTSGSNGAETAGPGYDLASGRGSLPFSPSLLKGPLVIFRCTPSLLTETCTDASTDTNPFAPSYFTNSWDFGDGSPVASGTPVSHTYAAAGTYTIQETVTDGFGVSASRSTSVTVAPAPPAALFTYSKSYLSVNFTDHSTDSEGGALPLTYSWNFGDGSGTATGATPSYTYANAGTYTVVETVTNNYGISATHSIAIPVAHAAPVAVFSDTKSNLTANFTDKSIDTEPGASISSYAWDFGDGSGTGTGPTPSYTYAAPGTYNVTETVTNNFGVTGSRTAAVTVAHSAPTTLFSDTKKNLTVNFTDKSTDTESGALPLAYSWNFGDGSPAGTGPTPIYTYATPGTYNVTETVTNNFGVSSSRTLVVTVAHSAPTALFAAVRSGLKVTFTDKSSDTESGALPLSYSWDFGDGTGTSTAPNPVYTYAAPGTYNVVETVTNNFGISSGHTVSVTVN